MRFQLMNTIASVQKEYIFLQKIVLFSLVRGDITCIYCTCCQEYVFSLESVMRFITVADQQYLGLQHIPMRIFYLSDGRAPISQCLRFWETTVNHMTIKHLS